MGRSIAVRVRSYAGSAVGSLRRRDSRLGADTTRWAGGADPTQLDVHRDGVGPRAIGSKTTSRPEEALVQLAVAHRVDGVPCKPDVFGAPDGARDRTRADADASCRLSMAAAEQQLLPQNFSHVSHGQSLRCHRASSRGAWRVGPSSVCSPSPVSRTTPSPEHRLRRDHDPWNR